MRGSLRKPRTEGASWSYRLDLGDGPDGRRQQKQVSGFATRKEAERALNEAMDRLQTKAFVAPTRQTLGEFLVDQWLPGIKMELAEAALTNYRDLMVNYVVPNVGQVRVSDVTPVLLQKLYGELLENGKRRSVGGLRRNGFAEG